MVEEKLDNKNSIFILVMNIHIQANQTNTFYISFLTFV